MRIPILYLPWTGIKKNLYIESEFTSNKYIIPIGCDCHPAYMLKKMHLRKQSLPFDWLNMKPMNTFEYVYKNVRDNFKKTMSDLCLNSEGYIISKNYPYAEFYHERDLITNKASREKIHKRINNLKELLEHKNIAFLHNIPSIGFKDQTEVRYYINYLKKFNSTLKDGDTIHIYIRYDNEISGNELNIDLLCQELEKLQVVHTKYSRGKKINGEWGAARDYPQLLKNLGITFSKSRFPKFYIS